MATPRYDNCDIVLLALCISVPLLLAAAGTGIDSPMPVEAPASPRDSAPDAAREAKSAVERLTQMLSVCGDNDTARHIRYCIGVNLFKAGRMSEAAGLFEQIAGDLKAPGLMQVCSLNMAGQIARLQGDHRRALDAFGRLIGLAEGLRATEPDEASDAVLRRLWCAASIGRAEIHELRKDHAAAADEYNRLLDRTDPKNDDVLRNQVPLVMDRLSQLHLQKQDISEYLNLTATLISRFPGYPRTPVIELESLCVRALRDVQPERQYPQGAWYAPVYLTEHLRRCGADGSTTEILDAVGRLCRKHQDAPMSALLGYHYAWMLDASGRRDSALDRIARVSFYPPGDSQPETSFTPTDPNYSDLPSRVRSLPARSEGDPNVRDTRGEEVSPKAGRAHEDVLREYAVIQHALMRAEERDYDRALQLLTGLPPDSDRTPHVSQLAEAARKSIQTLKREVPTNEGQQRN